MTTLEPSTPSLLATLPKGRLVELGRTFGVGVPAEGTKDQQVEALVGSKRLHFRGLLEWMGRDELRRACKSHGLDVTGRARVGLMQRLLEARGEKHSAPPAPLFKAHQVPRYAPHPGDVAVVRQRQYLVEAVHAPPEDGHLTRVDLVCLDDDNQGRPLSVLWERELGAQVRHPEVTGLPPVERLDPPRHFAAYLHALKWSSVTATDSRLFQSPFRAGIKLLTHQLTPLKKALELPRANLFIADDVGLGKTIEAGLVVQELRLRQRVDYVLIVCPAAISLQWKGEMERRFGLRFELYNREFVARRRRERGFGVNPWATHNRFIISYQTLRRPEYREPLLQHLGPRLKKSLLILDEAHTAAPATASKYAVDSGITRMVENLGPRFENRLFLSATPHNGHSNSFSALMELLDPQRFTRGVPVHADTGALDAVMERRLKRDLKDARLGSFPTRRVVRVALEHDGDSWSARPIERIGDKEHTLDASPLGSAEPVELELSRLLAEYADLMKPHAGRGQQVFVTLQKRLLSSIEAFHRTLQAHAERLERTGKLPAKSDLFVQADDEDEYGRDDEAADADDEAAVAADTAALGGPDPRARKLLDQMLELARRHRTQPDAKALALIDWIRAHQCAAVRPGGTQGKGKELDWSPRRVLVFTEYGDTKRYLTRILGAAIEGSRNDDERILGFHGAMSDDQRAEVQREFNGDPERHPVRILIATDAAREGLNLQSHCADLFHFDLPWNPARMEQRNGRIDRTLQPEPEVRCHYFAYPQRAEDAVLDKLVLKVDTIQSELGSLGDVIMQRLEKALEPGIGPKTPEALDRAEDLGGRAGAAREVVARELEAKRKHAQLNADIEEAAEILNRSAKVTDFRPELLHDAVDVGLELACGQPLAPLDGHVEGQAAFAVPALPESWTETLDSLRRPRTRNEPLWQWRKEPPQPVVFRPLERLGDDQVHLHLEHPFVQRIFSRFLAQGWRSHDLSRVTVVQNPTDNLVRVIAFGRLSLFGPGAVRLHDQLVSVAARWLDNGGEGHLKPFADAADRRAIDLLEQHLAHSPSLDAIPDHVRQRLLAGAQQDFATLWSAVRDEAESRAHEATQQLLSRGASEAEALRGILRAQRARIEDELGRQLAFDFGEREADQQRQFEDDKKHMQRRLEAIEREIESEPADIEALYRVSLKRLEPVGMVYLWPETRS